LKGRPRWQRVADAVMIHAFDLLVARHVCGSHGAQICYLLHLLFADVYASVQQTHGLCFI
jgi:hypothetical protein